MTSIRLTSGADGERVMTLLRDTFESRGYLWTRHDADTATATEGSRPVHNVATAQRLRIGVTRYPGDDRVSLANETVGAAYAAAGGGLITLRLGSRFRRIVRAARDDLAAAGLHRPRGRQ